MLARRPIACRGEVAKWRRSAVYEGSAAAAAAVLLPEAARGLGRAEDLSGGGGMAPVDGGGTAKAKGKAKSRKERLEAELRANLQRRKALARTRAERADETVTPGSDESTATPATED